MISDEQLVRQTVSGDVESFNRLVERYHGMVFNLAYRMLGDTSEAEDATQEAFLEGFKSVKGFQFQSTFKTWLYRVSINTCQQYIRKAESRQRILSSYTEGVAASQRVDSGPVRPDQHLLKNEREQIVQLAISDLPPARCANASGDVWQAPSGGWKDRHWTISARACWKAGPVISGCMLIKSKRPEYWLR